MSGHLNINNHISNIHIREDTMRKFKEVTREGLTRHMAIIKEMNSWLEDRFDGIALRELIRDEEKEDSGRA